MDAKITKQRLGNFLSYDWLKILIAIAAAAVALSLFFTMVGTRPTEAQSFEVYGYFDVTTGSDFNGLSDDLDKKDAFSYEMLTVTSESFSFETYGSTVYTARRSAGEGTVMFLTDFVTYDEEGKLKEDSVLKSLTANALVDSDRAGGGFFDTAYFMESSRAYLARFFGEDLTAELDEKAAEESFLARNNRDKRFLSESKKQKGIEQEKARLIKLKADYLAVEAAFGRGALTHRIVEDENGKTHSAGIGVGNLKGISNLFYYKNGEEIATADLALVIFYNNYGKQNELRYDTLSFLSYLVEKYG